MLLETGHLWSISNPWVFFGLPFLIFWKGLGYGDTQDRFWYNNAMAEGAQTYPHGIHKYYDMFSMNGYYSYYIDYYIAYVINLLSLFTTPFGLPPDVLWGIKEGTSFENVYLYLILPQIEYPDYVLPIINLPLERGFLLG